MKEMKVDNLNFMEDDAFNRVIVGGLLDTYKTKPKYPIEYLAKYLLNQVDHENIRLREVKEADVALKEAISYKERLLDEASSLNLSLKLKKRMDLFNEDVILKIKRSPDILELLSSSYLEQLKKIFRLSSIKLYINDFPLKKFDIENEMDKDAHLMKEESKKTLRLELADTSVNVL